MRTLEQLIERERKPIVKRCGNDLKYVSYTLIIKALSDIFSLMSSSRVIRSKVPILSVVTSRTVCYDWLGICLAHCMSYRVMPRGGNCFITTNDRVSRQMATHQCATYSVHDQILLITSVHNGRMLHRPATQ